MFPLIGEAAALGAAIIWSGSTSLYTFFGVGIPAQILNLFKNTVAFLFLTLTVLIIAAPITGSIEDYLALALSGVIGLSVGDTALFAALKKLGAQITSSIQCLAPPISAGLALLFLDEQLTTIEWAGMLVTVSAITGVILTSRKARALTNLSRREIITGVVFAILAATCQGTAIVIGRYAFQNVDVIQGTLCRVFPATIVLSILVFKNSRKLNFSAVSANRRKFFYLAVASFAGTFLGLILMSIGVKFAKAGIAAALTSTYPIWIIPIARFILKEQVTAISGGLTVLAVAGIVLMML